MLHFFDKRHHFYYGGPIDVVYTWVNGSDPIFQQNLNKYLSESKLKLKDSSYERFNDKDELKFSIRYVFIQISCHLNKDDIHAFM